MMYNHYIGVLTISALVSVFMLYVAIIVRSAPKSLFFSYMILSVVFFNVGYVFELSGGGYDAALLAAKFEYFGIPFITPFLLLFVVEYCNHVTVKAKHVLMLMAIPAISALLVLTWPWSGLFYKELVYEPNGVVPRLLVTGGIMYYVYFAYTVLVALAAIVVVLRYRRNADASLKKPTTILLVGTTLPLVAFSINVLKIMHLPIDPTPVLLSTTCVLLGYAIFKQGLYRLTPIAHEQIVENLNDGVILTDTHGVFISANTAAKNLFSALRTIPAGAGMPRLDEITWDDGDAVKDFEITSQAGVKRYYQASRHDIYNNGKTIGSNIIIHDTTEAKARLDEAKRMAEYDALTGLINRGTLYSKGKKAFSAFTAQSSAVVLMVDIDLFKHINDTYGHLNGDIVIQSVARTLASSLRITDLLGRYGGEEFCAFLPHVDGKNGMEIAEKLKTAIEKMTLTLNGETMCVTISIGVAVYHSKRHPHFEAILSDADAALYQAKNAGRNCVKCFVEKT